MIDKIKTQVVVLGAGPGGYSSAFRCADLGIDTVLVERYSNLGGICLNVGCIPSKALLHIVKIIEDTKSIDQCGIYFNNPKIDLDKIRSWKDKIVNQLTTNLKKMALQRKIKVINGFGRFISSNLMQIENEEKNQIFMIHFDHAIIAAGSRPIHPPFIYQNDPRIWTSTEALSLKFIPNRLLIVGGGVIGLEMATVYHTLGSIIDIVEVSDHLIPSADKDISKIFTNMINNKFNLILETSITSIEAKDDGIYVSMIKNNHIPNNEEYNKKELNIPFNNHYDAVLISIGRIPNSNFINYDQAGVKIDNNGFIMVDKQMRTNVKNIFAIGDIVGKPMLAHKSIHEGHLAAEVISGKKYYFSSTVIPSIAYTDPEIAWVGLTEYEAKEKKINYEVAIFPWSALGRAISSNFNKGGITKLIFDKSTNRIIGGAIVGTNCGELLGEICLAIEMGCEAEDIALTIHAHPTLHESIGLAASVYEGTVTDIPNTRKK